MEQSICGETIGHHPIGCNQDGSVRKSVRFEWRKVAIRRCEELLKWGWENNHTLLKYQCWSNVGVHYLWNNVTKKCKKEEGSSREFEVYHMRNKVAKKRNEKRWGFISGICGVLHAE